MAVAAVLAALVLPAAATAASPFGIGAPPYLTPQVSRFAYCTAAPGTVPCPPQDLGGYAFASAGTFEASYFQSLVANMAGAGHMGWARFRVPYDDLQIAGASGGCVRSPVNVLGAAAGRPGAGQADFDQLVYELPAARADGPTPAVTFTGALSPGELGAAYAGLANPDPSTPEPGYGSLAAGAQPYAGETRAGRDYFCGVQSIMRALAPGNAGGYPPVTDWEAWNEPNGSTQRSSGGGGYNGSLDGACATPGEQNPCGFPPPGANGNSLCAPGSASFTTCGPVEAAELWELAEAAGRLVAGHAAWREDVAALSNSDPSGSLWDSAYASGILGSASGTPGFMPGIGQRPTVWAVHDYVDVTPIAGGAGCATSGIDTFTHWLAGHLGGGLTVWITESGIALRNPRTGASTMADGDPALQQQCARTFSRLPLHGNGERIAMLIWYELAAPNASNGWDSGLLSPDGGYFRSPDGRYAEPRTSYCVLAGAAVCAGSAVAASDWSDPAAAVAAAEPSAAAVASGAAQYAVASSGLLLSAATHGIF